ATGAEGRPDHAVKRQVQVGILPDHDGVLATQLQADALQRFGRTAADLDPGLGMTGEADDADVGVIDNGIAYVAAAPGHHVDHAGGDATLPQQLHEAHQAGRRVRGRLDDCRVAADQGRKQLPAGDRDWEVPGGDDAHHAD